ncbi:alpha/beta fold hydrolase [Imbroritus primus]|uniref:alpha/beta fold hydrolase n=1 Tax=Imbroritus primus TaxID=3058603 RepID=UPI003D1614CB
MPALLRHYRVLRLDLPGHGASSLIGGRTTWTVPQLANQVLLAADAAGIDQFSFVGVSVGGMIGLWLAANTVRVRRLVVSNTSASVDAGVWSARIQTAREQGLQALVDGTMQRWFNAGYLATDPVDVATIREHFLQVELGGYIGCSEAIRDVDLHACLAHISAPTLVIAGIDDAAMPPRLGRAIADAVPGAQYVELATAHIPHIAEPLPFLETILHHLAPGGSA